MTTLPAYLAKMLTRYCSGPRSSTTPSTVSSAFGMYCATTHAHESGEEHYIHATGSVTSSPYIGHSRQRRPAKVQQDTFFVKEREESTHMSEPPPAPPRNTHLPAFGSCRPSKYSAHGISVVLLSKPPPLTCPRTVHSLTDHINEGRKLSRCFADPGYSLLHALRHSHTDAESSPSCMLLID